MTGRTYTQKKMMQMNMGMVMPMSMMHAVKCEEVLPVCASCNRISR